MNIYKLIPLIIISTIFSQFHDVKAEIDMQRVKETQKYILSNFTYEIENYFLSNNFCPEYDYLDIPINIQFIIESISENGNEIIITTQVLISNYTDQYFFSKVIFPFHRGKSLNYNPNSHDYLISFLNYYANLFIGYQLDTFELNSGSTYYLKSLDISDEMRFKNFSIDWQKRKNEIKNIQDNLKLRNIRFNYYYIYDEINNGNNNFTGIPETIFEDLRFIYEKIGYDKNTLKFLDAHANEIASILKEANIKNSIDFLILFDEKNKTIYEQYLQ